MADITQIKPVKESAEVALLNRPGVRGVGIGYRHVGGLLTDERVIVIFVDKKQPAADLPYSDIIPAHIDDIPTDVVERDIIPLSSRVRRRVVRPQADAKRHAPLLGGISIGPCRQVGSCVVVGTAGAVVVDNASGAHMLLSNFHVMAVNHDWEPGSLLAQPARDDGGSCPDDVAAELRRAALGGQVDCAAATVRGREQICEIAEIGRVTGHAPATLGMRVRKRGCTTGLTYGIVDVVDLTVSVSYDDADCGIGGLGTITFYNQFSIAVDNDNSSTFGLGGDSGAVIVDSQNRIVGLYFAGTPAGDVGVANPIDAVLQALDVSVCTGDCS